MWPLGNDRGARRHHEGRARRTRIRLLAATAAAAWASVAGAAELVWISSLDLTRGIRQDWGKPRADRSVGGRPLSIGGRRFERGIGTHANSTLTLDLKRGAERLTAMVGVDDEVKKSTATVEFQVFGDGALLWKSGVLKAGQTAQRVDLPLKGVGTLRLVVLDAGDGIDSDHADWAEARLEGVTERPLVLPASGAAPPTPAPTPPSEPVILTPRPGPEPRINGPRVLGVRPGSPFLYSIPATGERPVQFTAEHLPGGLSLDRATGRITGALTEKGEHVVTLKAKNGRGSAERTLRIIAGDRIALTPPMGWNSWNCWAGAVDQDKVLRSARAMVASGLAQHGWSTVNIDDTWQGRRGGPLNAIQPNDKFPDMKGLCDEIHGLGLKAGIYSTPWVTSYARHVGGSAENPEGLWDGPPKTNVPRNKKMLPFAVGRYSFAKQDARQWAAWGFDYLKYDWNPIEEPQVREMNEALRATGRDVVYSLSNQAPFEGAADYARLANAWRTTGDIRDTWASMAGIGFAQDRWAPFAGPGHWNDPDMLVVGHVGWGPKLHPTNLTPDEQYTHISLWCLLSAPLLLGCDLARLDDFTLSLLTNDEVLDVDQDPLGKQAVRVAQQGEVDVYAKEMEDGSRAVGLFNRGLKAGTGIVRWADLGLSGRQRVRDLWRQKDLGALKDQFEAPIPPHGVVLVRLFPARS